MVIKYCSCSVEQRLLLIKTVFYRALGLATTIVTVYIFTHEFTISSGIGITDLFVKTINYYIYEAIWRKIKWGIKDNYDTSCRSFTKAVILRIEASSLTLLISYIFLGEIAISLWIALVEMVEKIALYYIVERIWLHIRVWFGPIEFTDGDEIQQLRKHCCGACQPAEELP